MNNQRQRSVNIGRRMKSRPVRSGGDRGDWCLLSLTSCAQQCAVSMFNRQGGHAGLVMLSSAEGSWKVQIVGS